MEDLIGYLDEIQSQLTFDAEIRSKRGGNFGHKASGAQRRPGNNANPLIMSKPELSAVQPDANDKVNEVADDGQL